jgi:hypothetical protein
MNNFKAGGRQMDLARANCAAPSVSGAFLGSAGRGLLHPLASEALRFAKLIRKRNTLRNKLGLYNNPKWMARLAEKTSPRKFKRQVMQEVTRLEAELAGVNADCELVRLRLQKDHPEIVAAIESSEKLSGNIDSTSRREMLPSKNAAIQKRNQCIRKFRHASHVNICFELDDASIPIPATWRKKFGVSNFSDAYSHPKCRRLVHRLLSGAKSTPLT